MESDQNKITIDATLLINLKAELVKKQEEFRQKKLSQTFRIKNTKLGEQFSKETKKTIQKSGATIDEKCKNEVNQEEEELLKKSARILQSKAQFYEEIIKGNKVPDQGDDETFMIDFEKKIIERIQKDKEQKLLEEVKYEGDTSEKRIKFKQTIDEEYYKEQLHRKWEEEQFKVKDKQDIHYQDLKFDEARFMGVGHFQFSTSEDKRKEQMEYFNKLKLETLNSRVKLLIDKKSREDKLKERILKVKQKLLLKRGYSLEEIEEILKKDREAEEEQNDGELDQEDIPDEMEEDLKDKKEIPVLVREWDQPKLKEPKWSKIIQNLRNERNMDFAPPTSYDRNKTKSKKKRKLETTEETDRMPKIIPPSFPPPPFPNLFAFPPPLIPQAKQQKMETDDKQNEKY